MQQLADQTGEESLLLTASLSEGSLSHLGSESGTVFLEDHEAQFFSNWATCFINVQQLADQTGEESLLLTASVSEGSLSHLGSEIGL